MSENEIINELKLLIDSYLKENYLKQLVVEQDGGKVPKSRRVLPPINKSYKVSLSKYGYKLSKSQLARHKALKKASRAVGTLDVLKRVNLIGNYSKSVPYNYKVLRDDVEYLKD